MNTAPLKRVAPSPSVFLVLACSFSSVTSLRPGSDFEGDPDGRRIVCATIVFASSTDIFNIMSLGHMDAPRSWRQASWRKTCRLRRAWSSAEASSWSSADGPFSSTDGPGCSPSRRVIVVSWVGPGWIGVLVGFGPLRPAARPWSNGRANDVGLNPRISQKGKGCAQMGPVGGSARVHECTVCLHS